MSRETHSDSQGASVFPKMGRLFLEPAEPEFDLCNVRDRSSVGAKALYLSNDVLSSFYKTVCLRWVE